ncbi:CPBP family intramembrane glutamic endopeptidase [Crateriforma conspicua]|uniref:CAAX amino terminal protease self-immunity n=1 Tax=Crateriforma conspicua TaxID=2527996 RepID=A0A5C5Y982_9PLAN|nr:CPBP family intramembrane glutamic endopeptidase [Crateriforma conspicua]QDV61507.1 CAAX amino terminal protease self- immunity [Crateriforma conspicua]TWT72246.1 CAAX amino terminal protease self- immunity [Crateriforma conspicua]
MDDSEDEAPQTADDVFRTAVIFESALGLLALFLGWLLGPDPRALVPKIDLSVFQWDVWSPVVLGIGYGMAAAIPMLLGIAVLRRLPLESVRELERLSDDGMLRLLLQLGPLELILISLCAGVGEELLFRGWLMQWLSENPSGVSGPLEIGIGLIGSSIAFGLVHPITRLYVVVATVIGLYLGVLLLLSGNLLIPIAAHATYDAVQLMMTAWQKSSDSVDLDESVD